MRLADAVAEIMVQELPALAPPRRLVPIADLAFATRPRVLVVGKPLSARDARELGVDCELVGPRATIAEALAALAGTTFDAVIVFAGLAEEGDGIRFVRVVKTGSPPVGFEHVWTDYSTVPFIIPPLEGDDEYLVFESAASWFLGDARALSFARAVRMTLRRDRWPKSEEP